MPQIDITNISPTDPDTYVPRNNIKDKDLTDYRFKEEKKPRKINLLNWWNLIPRKADDNNDDDDDRRGGIMIPIPIPIPVDPPFDPNKPKEPFMLERALLMARFA